MSPFGGPSRNNLSRDMLSAARDRRFKAERLPIAEPAGPNCCDKENGASLFARPRGERLTLTFLRVGEGGRGWGPRLVNCCAEYLWWRAWRGGGSWPCS